MLGKVGLRTLVSLGLVAILLSGILPAGAAGSQEGRLLVTLREGAHADDVARRLGVEVLAQAPGTGVLLVEDKPGLARRLARDPAVAAVEPDGTVSIAGAIWNGATWNGATWNGATWNGATWNGATWNGATWNGATWNGATWNGATWNGATWNGATWNGATWNGATWNGATWNGNNADGLAPPWGPFAIRAPQAWVDYGVPQHNRLVCIVDTGVDAAHPALAANMWTGPDGAHGFNVLAPGAPPMDDEGHGTHLAGIVAAVHDDVSPIRGVGAPLVAAVKALDATGHGRTGDVILGLAWCGAQKADVVLLAFTEDAPTRAFRAAVAALQREGALVVASSGNAGCDRCVSEPAALPGVMGVGAFAPDGSVPAFSSRGPHVDLLAPGVSITSAYPGAALRTGSGTSQAAAFAAGAAAYLWSHAPDWPAPRVAAHLERTADDGRLDVAAAIAAAGVGA